ncbi:hypothetical protein [Actinophytocola sp. KF-1]
MRSLLITAALVAGLVGAAPAADATTRGLPPVLSPSAGNQFPEGVAWDPSRQSLLVGSLTRPALVTAVGRDGVNRTVVSDPGLPGFVGMKVDAARRRIVAVYGNPQVPGVSGLAVYDLVTGARERLVDLAGGTNAANDVALDPAGNAYVTDAGSGAVYGSISPGTCRRWSATHGWGRRSAPTGSCGTPGATSSSATTRPVACTASTEDG